MYFVYAIYNTKHKKTYIGQTQDLGERLLSHDKKIFRNSYTARLDGKWALVYSEDWPTRREALLREKQLKSYQGRQFIKKYIPQ